MNRYMTVGMVVVFITLCFCTQSMALAPDELLAIRREYAAAMNAHDLDKMMSFYTEDATYLLVNSPPPANKAGIRGAFEQRFTVLNDFHTDEDIELAGENIVVVEHNAIYTHPSGHQVINPHIDIYDFEGDKIKRATTYSDGMSAAVQIGKMSAPELPELIPSIPVPDPEPTGLSPMEANTELIARWNSRDAAHVAMMDSSDFQIFAGPLGTTLDRAAMTALNEMYFTAFPDVQIEVVRAVELQDGWVLTELISKGTHEGEFMGVPASGYLTGLRVVWLTRYDGHGLVTDQSFYYDNLTLMNQMTTPPYSLDGIWISTVPTPMGNLILTTNYVAQNSEKTQYSGSLEEINPMPLLADVYPGADPKPRWAGGHAVMVGRDRYEATFLGYSLKTVETEIGKMLEPMGVFTVKAHFELIGPDSLYGMGTGSYYLASQDADRNGFPDEGEEPVVCLPWGWTGKRLTLMPPCVPTPVP